MTEIKGVNVRFNLPNGEVYEGWFPSLEAWEIEKQKLEASAGTTLPKPTVGVIQEQ
jgi:hypothetical protein